MSAGSDNRDEIMTEQLSEKLSLLIKVALSPIWQSEPASMLHVPVGEIRASLKLNHAAGIGI